MEGVTGGKIMNKNILRSFLLISLLVQQCLLSAPAHVLTFFIQPYPLINSVKKKNNTKGVFFTYFGYRTVSDSQQQVTFPLKTINPNFHILVTTNSKPLFMLDNTIAHWEVKNNATYSFFSVAREYDEKTKLYFWSTEQINLPKSLEIPLNTIVVYADPEDIYIPTGVTLTTDNPQLVLPTIYIKPTIRVDFNEIKFLEHCEFFAPIDRTFKLDINAKESKI